MARKEIRREVSDTRCAWCMQPIYASSGQHVVVAGKDPPFEDVHLHQSCWLQYRKIAPAMTHRSTRKSPFRNKDVRYWTPERIERVRKLMHMTVTEFRIKLRRQLSRGSSRSCAATRSP
jgi:hypothetical protein